MMTVLASSSLDRFLAKLASRSMLDEKEQDAILNLPAKAEQVPPNQDFVRLGEHVTHSCLVVEGLAGRIVQNREGSRQIIALYIPGDMVDLNSVVAPEATSGLQALTVTTIVRVPHSDLRRVAHRFPAIAEAFWRECVLDAAVLSEWVMNVGRRDARSRTAHLLCEVACRYDEVGRGSSFNFAFPITQTQLSDVLALTPVHVNRVLRSLRQDGIVEIHSKRVFVLNWAEMARLGDFDPSYLRIGTRTNHQALYRYSRTMGSPHRRRNQPSGAPFCL